MSISKQRNDTQRRPLFAGCFLLAFVVNLRLGLLAWLACWSTCRSVIVNCQLFSANQTCWRRTKNLFVALPGRVDLAFYLPRLHERLPIPREPPLRGRGPADAGHAPGSQGGAPGGSWVADVIGLSTNLDLDGPSMAYTTPSAQESNSMLVRFGFFWRRASVDPSVHVEADSRTNK